MLISLLCVTLRLFSLSGRIDLFLEIIMIFVYYLYSTTIETTKIVNKFNDSINLKNIRNEHPGMFHIINVCISKIIDTFLFIIFRGEIKKVC